MTKNVRSLRCAIAGAFVAACAASGVALAVDEQVDPHASIADAQELVVDATRSVTVTGFLQDGAADFYSFWAKEGDVVTFDVDGDGTIDSWLTVLLPDLTVERSQDDSELPIVDVGSSTALDPYIEIFRIPATGVYFVAVTAQPTAGVFPYLPVLDGGVVNVSRGNATGTYSLILSNVSPKEAPPAPAPDPVTPPAPAPDPVTPPAPAPDPVTPPAPAPDPVPTGQVQQINIDIKPGRGMIVRLDPKGKHSIPVALLSSKDFNPMSVDVSSLTLTFGHTGDEKSLRKCAAQGVDVNRDRRRDLVCEFANDMAQFELGDTQGIVRGKTKDGTPFEGRGMLKVIPYKRHHGRHFDGHDRRDDDDDRGRQRDREHRR